ncbi:hypothetical protein RugamoR64_26820 [Duganella rhizosphaerae]|uniref:PEP-CTERM sorting domain-containing protein n=1 Tax=Duganella rhizosphaerae TaxID=2885763 RepID=UPI0030E87CD6
MTIKFNTAIKAAAVAAALLFSTASHAALTEVSNVDYFNFDANIYSHGGSTSLTTWSLTGVNALAFCIEPDVDANKAASYGVNGSYVASDYVKALYETSYRDVISAGGVYNANNAAAFQLALWEALDDHNFNNVNGKMYLPNVVTGFDADVDAVTAAAHVMMDKTVAFVDNHGAANTFAYTAYSAADSQGMLTVSAVPEADTWAMMVVGLGLLGLVSRRKSDKSETFA